MNSERQKIRVQRPQKTFVKEKLHTPFLGKDMQRKIMKKIYGVLKIFTSHGTQRGAAY